MPRRGNAGWTATYLQEEEFLGLSKFVAALSPVAVLNATASLRDVEVLTELRFAKSLPLTLDVYKPVASRTVAVFLYGGGWESGDKAMYRFVGAALASRGITTVIPNYRVYPEVRYPAFLQDCAEAVRWTLDRCCGDGQRPVLVGHSAGAYNAAMLALDPRWLGALDIDPYRRLAGLVGLAGPYDFLPLTSPTLMTIFGPEEARPATQPINYVGAKPLPALLAAGRHDRVVDPQNGTRLGRRMREAGGEVEVKFYPLAAHANLVGAFAAPLRWLAPVLSDTVRFIEGVTESDATAATPGEVVPC
jgi:acetyl esterase/lipase